MSSSPVHQTKKRNTRAAVVLDESDDDHQFYDAETSVISEKENNAQSPSPSPKREKDADTRDRRASLVPLDPNALKLQPTTKLEPPSPSVIPASPKTKPSFNGPDIIDISPKKANKNMLLANMDKNKEPVTRLVITKLVLTNFKSYAGEQVIGPFHSSFSAIVGPNGSGKSNVIDSMLFVFGFRANKMRQGKLSELIHNSEAAPNLPFCSVEIHFQHVTDNLDDTTTVVPNSDLIVSRKAYRNNSSEYLINNKRSNYKEVTSLLKEKGIDLDHKRFLILQGEVESIAQMKPKGEKENDDGLLEYLEDIIGTSNYKTAIEDSFKSIEELNEVCQEKENRFKIVEKEKNSLESNKNDALLFLSKEKEIIENKSLLFQYKKFKLDESIEINKKQLDELIENLKKEKNQTSEFQKEIKVLENQYKSKQSEFNSLDEKIKSILNIVKKSDREKISTEEKKKSLENKKKKSQKLLDTATHSLSQSESNLKTINSDLETQNSDLEGLRNELKVEKKTLDEIRLELTDKTKEINKEIEKYENQLQPWNTKIENKKSEISVAESQLKILKDELSKVDNEITEINEKIETIINDGKENEKKLNRLKKEQIHVDQQIELGEVECNNAQEKLNEMNEILSNQRQKTMDARSSISTKQNKSKVLSALMRLQESGRIQGFYGRLGDLGYIDDKYDVAISTACGQLDDMVVETVEVGQQCIEYLRKNNLGYARFILLTKLRKFNLNRIHTPNNTPRLFDLVQPKDPKFAPAFYSVLMDTLVADTLKEANAVAYGPKRYRVVTIDGKLIDKSGTLSGGGNYVSRGGMKSTSEAGLISENEVISMERDLERKEHDYNIAQNAYYEMTNGLKELKDRKPEIENLISQCNFEIESLSTDLNNFKKQLVELNHSKKIKNSNQQDFDKVNAKIKSLKEEHSELNEQSKELQDKISELKEQIMQVGGVKLRLQSSKVDSLNERIDILSRKIQNNKISAKKLSNEIKRFEKSKLEKIEEIETIEQQLDQVEIDYAKKIEEFAKLEKQLNELEGSKDELSLEIDKLKESLDEKVAKVTEFKSTQVELENTIEKNQSQLKNELKRSQHYFNQLQSLEARDASELISFIESEEERLKYCNPSLSELSPDEINALDIKEIESTLEELEEYMRDAKVNVDVLEEYGRRLAEHNERKNDLNESVSKRDEAKETTEKLKKRRLDEFMEGFNIISGTLKEMYQMITMGGNAELELVDSLDPFSEGILFSVMPPKKSWKNISNLSGGEKTLSSLALVFALHRYKPTPLYVMDEIDAALDFRNVSIVANYIKDRTKNAQFVVISLRNNMFELAQQLVGIYKVNNMTRSITMQNRDLLGNE